MNKRQTLEEPENGLPQEVLDWTDVLIWWGHCAHDKVSDETARRVQLRVLDGMGLIVLHSGHLSKPFVRLMGTVCRSKWRENDELERIWVIEPGHPIARDLPEYIELPQEETYGERFEVPAAAATGGGWGRFSTSGPATRNTRRFTAGTSPKF